MPVPLSATVIQNPSSPRPSRDRPDLTRIAICPPCSVASIAFDSRLVEDLLQLAGKEHYLAIHAVANRNVQFLSL